MGERTTRVNGNDRDKPLEPVKQTRVLETEIEHLRGRLDRSLSELDRRRHEYTDVRLQLKKHPQILIGAGVVGALLVGGIVLAVWRSRKREEPVEKAKRFRLALGRAVDKPDRVAKGQPSVPEKILAAVGTTIAVSLTKKLLEKAWAGPRST